MFMLSQQHKQRQFKRFGWGSFHRENLGLFSLQENVQQSFKFVEFWFYSRNPDKGVLINRPKGENVYQGVKIDYKGKVRHQTLLF